MNNATSPTAHNHGAAHLDQASFDKALADSKTSGKPLIVDFYADWCGPCQLAAPVIEKLAGEFADKAVIAKLNVDEANAVASQHGVMSIPTVIVFKDGEEVDRKIGFPGEPGYRAMIEEAIA